MAIADRDPVVVVAADESLDDVLDRLRDAAKSGQQLELVVPIDNPLLLTASEFRRLKDAADAERLPIIVRTADPLRLRLAERLGLRARALTAAPSSRRVAVPIVPPEPVAAPSLVSPDPVSSAPLASQNGPQPPLFVSQPDTDPEEHWPRLDRAEPAAAATELEVGEAEADTAPAAASRSRSLLRWLVGAAVLVALVGGAYLAIQFAIPSATIAITPVSTDVKGTVLFDVTANGEPLDDRAAFALTSGTRQVTVTWEGSTPASGSRSVPDATATGVIELRNASPEAVTVGRDAVMTTEAGVEFSLTEPVIVPAADASTNQPGVATGQIRALMAGTGGNVGKGEVGGRLADGIYYSNLEGPTAGGTDREFIVVSQADLDALLSQAQDSVLGLARDAIAAEDSDTAVTVTNVAIASQEDVFDRQVDEEAESVSLRATMVLDATTYDQATAMTKLMPIVQQQLVAQAPAGAAIDPADLALSEPKVVETEERGARVEIDANGTAWQEFSEAEKQSLAAMLAGVSDEEAATMLRDTPGIADFSVSYAPSWLPREMPNNAGRITLQVEHP